ncbi:arginine deiminase [Anaerovorax odorimutans]|uniref:arginine deiminase n=1 Tax=Anaerovorax odorimutans TaxID=109327 RepID=UPI000402C167|nr:arginine deiminase [Anaerovorax odorimutans]
MKLGVNVYSEIGKLNRVMLHKLGEEIEGLVPDNFERLLFDDIPYLKAAQHEHDCFARVLKQNNVEVLYFKEQAIKALSSDEIRKQFLKEFLRASEIHSNKVRDALHEFLMSLSAENMVNNILAGIKKKQLFIKTNSLADFITEEYPYYTDPMPNLYFTRDPGACIGDGLCINSMNTRARKRESLLLKYMFMYNKYVFPDETNKWYDYGMPHSIEGGDILVLSKKIVAVGYSQRTSADAIEILANRILGYKDFQKVLVFEIPKCRAFMHLDTVFTMVDFNKFAIHSEIEEPLNIYEVTLDKDKKPLFSSNYDNLEIILKKELNLQDVELIRCGGNDKIAAQREQWSDGSNTLAISPGTVITYDRNYVTNELLDKHGVKVLTISSSELSRGRGGPRCMSMPVNREDI